MKLKAISLLSLAITLPGTAAAAAAGNFIGTNFQGTDRNWFNPANWSTGRVPGPNDVVILDGTDDVVIDPALAGTRVPGQVNVNALWMRGQARLETLAGTRFDAGTEVVDDAAQLIHRSSTSSGELLIAGDQAPGANAVHGIQVTKMVLNPTSQSKRTYVLKSSVVLEIGLGGREPAGITKAGAGRMDLTGYAHHATVNAETVILGDAPPTQAIAARLTGLRSITARIDKLPSQVTARIDRLPRLQLVLHYGFEPAAGDEFRIITANTLAGQFQDLPEGALVGCTENNVGLTITYRGGDGNDVVLSAADTAPDVCATKEHILLARQVGVPG